MNSRGFKPIVVVADNDANLLEMMEYHLSDWGYRVVCVQDATQLRQSLAELPADLVLLDLGFGDQNGLAVLAEHLPRHLCPPIVVFAANGSIDHAVQAIKLGAWDYLAKPADLARLKTIAATAVERHRVRVRGDGPGADDSDALRAILGNSRAVCRVRELISDVAVTDAKVLILGESGTGKELVARAIHDQSPRANNVFAPVNMAALPPGLAESVLFGHEKGAFTGADSQQKGWCELADEGTLFLDEIGEMDLALQAKLLRFLQDSSFQRVGSNKQLSVNVRIVAATNRDPAMLLREGRVREDLYYRLNVLPIVVPPLRERREDILLLAQVFLDRAVKNYGKNVTGFSDAVVEILLRYHWPGNIRQLQHTVERLVILSRSSTIGTDDVPAEMLAVLAFPAPTGVVEPQPEERSDVRYEIRHIEKEAILKALLQTEWNVVQAARILGLGQATVYRKMKRYGISLKRNSQAADGQLDSSLPRIVAS